MTQVPTGKEVAKKKGSRKEGFPSFQEKEELSQGNLPR